MNAFVSMSFPASNVIVEAEALASQFRNTTPVMLDAQRDPGKLEQLIKDHDIVVRYYT